MRLIACCLLSVLISSPVWAEEDSPATNLGQSLVGAITTNDVVAYSQCWLSAREGAAQMKALGKKLSEEELAQMRQYLFQRNRKVAESFLKLQELLNENNVDRTKIRFKSCEVQGAKEQKAPQGKRKQATGFAVTFQVEEEEWKLTIDDGVMVHGLWYFSDSPTTLDAGGRIVRFKVQPRKTNR